MTVENEKNGVFLLTIIVPDEFLDDPETVFPVTVDPIITIYTNLNSANIIDAAVYKKQPNMNAGTWQYNNIGYTDSTYGLARTVIKLSALLSDSTYQSLTANQINNVTFSVKESTGNSSKTVKLHPITGTPTWTESTVTWNNYGSYDSSVNYGGTLTGGQRTSFNITNLVKAWKNGSYNGNGCFIFIMGGTENSQNRALDATEYSGTGNRPYLSLTYTPAVSLSPSSVYINEGSLTSATCNVAPEGTYRFEWQTDRSEIATCSTINDSSSVVTGVRSGYTYLTVNVYDSNNNWIDDATAMVFVLKPDGIYKIINSQELRPLKSDGTISNEMSATMSTVSYDSGPEIDRIKVMWRIKHIIYGYYSVRPLYKSDTCLASDSNNNAVSRYTGTTDTWDGTAWDEKWKIEWETDNNYCLTQYTSGKRLTIHFNNLEDQDAVFVRTDTASNERCQWLFQPVNDVPIGIYLYDMATGDVFVNTPTKYIAPEETRSYTDIGVAPVAYSSDVIDQSFSWFSGVIADATVTSSGNVTGVNSTGNGYVGIFVRWDCQEHSNVTNKYWLQVLNVANGLYYLENRTVEYFASIIDTNVVSNVTKVYQHEFLGENNMLWQINRFDDNYYTITSYNYPSFKLSTFDPLTVNSDIVVQSGTVTDDMLWKIEPTSAGAYKLISKSSGNNSWVLATNTSNQTNGIKLILGQYVVNDSYRDEWFMCRQNNTIYDTLLLSVYHTGGDPFDTYQGMGNSIHFLQDIGKKVNFIKTEYTPVGTLFDFLNNSSIAVIGSHGASYSQNEAPYYLDMTEMLLYNNSWTNPEFQSKIRSIDIYNQVTGHSLGQVSNLDLIIYLGCKTGAETFNLCTQSVVDFSIGGVTYNGAEIAIGFKNNITSPSCNKWLKEFFKYYSQNFPVDECVEHAANSFGNDENGLRRQDILIAYRED